jgi:predicted nucleotidyltransferase
MNNPLFRSVSDRLKRIAREKQATYSEILTQFLIERAVARLAIEPGLPESLVFKGGFVSLRVYGSPRFTSDLDAIIYRKNRDEIIKLIKNALSKSLSDHVWFIYENNVDLITQGEYGGVRLA